MGYDYDITYKKGKENLVADALSRQFETLSMLCAISAPLPQWIEPLRQEIL